MKKQYSNQELQDILSRVNYLVTVNNPKTNDKDVTISKAWIKIIKYSVSIICMTVLLVKLFTNIMFIFLLLTLMSVYLLYMSIDDKKNVKDYQKMSTTLFNCILLIIVLKVLEILSMIVR